MSKYFSAYGVDLTVYTPENPEYPVIDKSTLEEISRDIKVIRQPIFEPYSFYKRFVGKNRKEKIYSGFINDKKSLKQKFSIWVRGNYFIPDARKFWIKPSVKFLKAYLKENKQDAIISTGPPHSMHLIALKLKEIFPSIKWIADFRDPWTNIDFYQHLMLSKRADKKHKILEKQVLTSADEIVAVGYTMSKELSSIGNRIVRVITNGYDHKDFKNKVDLEKTINISHIGSINQDRNPEILWQSMAELIDSNEVLLKDFRINLIGHIDGTVNKSIKKHGLSEYVNVIEFLPHPTAIEKMQSSHALLLIINNTPNAESILTGKLFEYLGAKRPVICIGPKEGDTKKILSDIPGSYYISYDDKSSLKKAIVSLIQQDYQTNEIDTNRYTRKYLAGKYCNLIDNLVNEA
jgi:hypothetical protein